MSALGVPVLINSSRAYWLSSIGTDVIHSTIQTDTIDANLGNISTLFSDQINVSTLNVSSLSQTNADVSGMYVSTIRGNTAFFSSMSLASDLSGGVGYVRFSVDASGIQVDGDPIRFDNLVYLTSTINIVQVSTIVDTDIFAQRGFFSTLSSGSLSSGVAQISSIRVEDLSANYGAFNNLFVSSLEALDISGVASGKNWSLYPTLNSSITFQPGFVLSNVGANLYFAGVEITDVSGGGQDWSRFPALSTVQMNNNSLTGLSTLQWQDGGKLVSLTGNDLFYNGQPIAYGAASNVSQWANYAAVSNVNMSGSNLSNAGLLSGSNLNLTGSNVTNGNTFTGTLSVAGTTLIPLASINNLGQLSCQDIDVSNPAVGLADVNIYGATALPGDNALYVEGGVTCAGGTIHGFTAGVLPVAGINTGRIDMLQAGFNLLHPLVGAITTGAALGITAGGALSLAGGGYVEMNTSTLQMINTSQGNKNTTIQAGFLTIDPDLAATSSIKLFNTLGGGVEIDGGGQGSLQGFSTLIGNNLSTINLQVSTINGVPLSSIQTPDNILCSNITVSQSTNTSTLRAGLAQISTNFWNLGLGVSTISASFLGQNFGVTNSIFASTNIGQIDAQIIGFSTIQGGQISSINLQTSTINGLPVGSATTISSFNTLQTSSLKVSTISGTKGDTLVGSTMFVEGGIQFVGGAQGLAGQGSRFLSSLRSINNTGQGLEVSMSTMDVIWNGGINPNGYVRIGDGGAFDGFFRTLNGSTSFSTPQILARSTISQEVTTSSLGAYGGLPLKLKNTLEFVGANAIDNVAVINLNPPAIQALDIGASTINLTANNVFTTSLSTINHSTSAFSFSTARCFQSNTAYNYPLFIEADHAGAGTNASGVAIAVQGHNLGTGAVRNQIEMGARANGEAYIMSSWPGNNLEDLYIDSTEVVFRDGAFSTIVNLDPYGLITNGAISAPQILLSSINTHDARPAYTNNIQTSTMELYAASTTLMYWDSTTTSENINTSGYDVVVGLNGVFKIGGSFQFISPGAADEVEFFVLKNDNVISQAGGICEVANNSEIIQYFEVLEPLVNGDKIQLGCFTNGTNVFASTINGNVIQSPAVIMTMYKVD